MLPTYYFHLRDGEDLLLDPEGRRLPSLDSVVGAALYEARAIISADAKSGKIRFDQRIDVVDEAGAIIHRLLFEDSVEIVPHTLAVGAVKIGDAVKSGR